MKSATGSAINTAVVLFEINIGIIYINGINNIIFLNKAKNNEVFAFPKAINDC